MKFRQKIFSEYDAFHQDPRNKLTHYVGIPAIMIGLLGLLNRGGLYTFTRPESVTQYFSSSGHTWTFTLAHALWIFAFFFYLRVDLLWGFVFSFMTFSMLWLGQELGLTSNIALFVGGWILQLIGHYRYEKKAPAFLQNLTHLLVGPIWIFYKILKLKS